MYIRRMFFVVGLLGLVTSCAGARGEASDSHSPDDGRSSDSLVDTKPERTPDSGTDVIIDSGFDSVSDTLSDTLFDTASDTWPDTLPDSSSDSSSDSGPDSAVDAVVDVMPDLPPLPEVPLPGFGEISGACGVLTPAELTDESPYVFINHLDLDDDPYEDEDLQLLTAGGQEIWSDGNAGGSSIYSEIFAYEVLYRCELAVLLKTEMEVEYLVPDSKITDLVVEIDGSKIGVSVTRAVGWPRDAEWTTGQATSLLEKKLQGIQDSSAAVAPGDAWTKQILHIIAYSDQHAEVIEATLAEHIPPELAGDTIVMVTVSDGDDGFLY